MGWRLLAGLLVRARACYWQAVYRGLRARYDIDPAFRFNGAGIQLYGEGTIQMGPQSYVGEYSTFQAAQGMHVRVGRACRISHNVRVYTETSRADTDFRSGLDVPVRGNVAIGDGTWIGANVFIGPGIVIGANAVIGANSVVTVDVPDNEIWGGVPARRLRAKQGAVR
jgi:maltose O-acetyltransferase